MMRKIMQWMVAATLTSSLFVWTSCSNDDNAVIPQVAEGVIGPSLREGVCYTSEELSRKQIVPRITEVLTGN